MKKETRLHDEHLHLRPHGVSPLPRHRLAPVLAACEATGVVPGIREHAPLPVRYRLGPDEDYLLGMRPNEVEGFLDELEGTGVTMGLEVDHIDGCESETRAIVLDLCDRARARGIPIGGLTGSVHFVPGCVADLGPGVDKRGVPYIMCDYLETVTRAHVAERGPVVAIREYFAAVRSCIRMGFYDVIGPVELIRKFDREGPDGESELFPGAGDVYEAELEATIRLAGEAGAILEYNTSGTDVRLGRPYLSERAVRACVRHGVRLALSSDAHSPKHVARYFDRAVATLRGLGVRELYAVRDRVPIAISIT